MASNQLKEHIDELKNISGYLKLISNFDAAHDYKLMVHNIDEAIAHIEKALENNQKKIAINKILTYIEREEGPRKKGERICYRTSTKNSKKRKSYSRRLRVVIK